jgi:hypothetical protein
MFPMCIYDTKSILWAVGSEMYIGFKFVIPWDGLRDRVNNAFVRATIDKRES